MDLLTIFYVLLVVALFITVCYLTYKENKCHEVMEKLAIDLGIRDATISDIRALVSRREGELVQLNDKLKTAEAENRNVIAKYMAELDMARQQLDQEMASHVQSRELAKNEEKELRTSISSWRGRYDDFVKKHAHMSNFADDVIHYFETKKIMNIGTFTALKEKHGIVRD